MLTRIRAHIPFPAHPPALVRQTAHPLLLLAGVALLGVAVTTSATVVHLDAALGRLTRADAPGVLDHVDFMVSALGGTGLALPLTAAAALLLVLLRHWRGALTIVVAVLATQVVVQLIKLWVERPRPAANGELAGAGGFSFPSAHSATSMALYATLALVAARACRGRAGTMAVIAVGAGLIAAVGFSRVLLGAHYPIDVLAGWLTGGALVAASWLLARPLLSLLAPAPRSA